MHRILLRPSERPLPEHVSLLRFVLEEVGLTEKLWQTQGLCVRESRNVCTNAREKRTAGLLPDICPCGENDEHSCSNKSNQGLPTVKHEGYNSEKLHEDPHKVGGSLFD